MAFDNAVSSIESITATIENDSDTFHWFSYVICQPAVISRLSAQADIKIAYQLFKKTMLQQRLTAVTLLIFLLVIVCLQKYKYFWLAFLFIYPLIKLNQAKKGCVVEISRRLLLEDFAESVLCQKTLYQIAEEYSRRLEIPSLVDSIYFRDRFLRRSILVGLVGGVLIFTFSPLQALLIVGGSFFIVCVFLNSHLFYRFI